MKRITINWQNALSMFIVVSVVLLLSFTLAEAQDYPSRPITLVVWSSPGGGGDIFGRTITKIAEEISPDLTFIVINKGGGGTSIGRGYVAMADNDGYTLLNVTGNLTLSPWTIGEDYDLSKFEPVVRLTKNDALIVVSANAPWDNLDDLVKDAQSGKRIIIGGAADIGGNDGIVGFQLAKAGDFELNWITFDGAGEVTTQLLGRHIDVGIGDPSAFTAQLEVGELKVLAVCSEQRSEYYPDKSTAIEQGYDIMWEDYRGIVAPKNTPKERLEFLYDLFSKVYKHPDFEKYKNMTWQEGAIMNPEEFTSFLEKHKSKSGDLLKEIGIID